MLHVQVLYNDSPAHPGGGSGLLEGWRAEIKKSLKGWILRVAGAAEGGDPLDLPLRELQDVKIEEAS